MLLLYQEYYKVRAFVKNIVAVLSLAAIYLHEVMSAICFIILYKGKKLWMFIIESLPVGLLNWFILE